MKRIIGIVGLLSIFLIVLINTSLEPQTELTTAEITEMDNGMVVLELFTSQGCSSCPPADELLQKINETQSDNVYTIAYHVDYWNYIGWEDPFSRPEFTAKQTEYNKKFRNRSNYTPQLVVNGKDHFVGSNARKLYQNIQLYGSTVAENTIEITSIDRQPQKILLEYQIDGPVESKRLRAVLLIEERITEIKRGENRNRTLSNSNIAIAEAKRTIDGKSGSVQLIIPDLVHPDDKLAIVLIVEKENSDIVGAARKKIS